MASELQKLTLHPYNDLDLPLKDLKFEKNSTSQFTFMVDSIKFLYNMTTRNLVFGNAVPYFDRLMWYYSASIFLEITGSMWI